MTRRSKLADANALWRLARGSRAAFAALVVLLPGAASAQFVDTEVSGRGARPFFLTKGGWSWEDISASVPAPTYNVYRRQPGAEFRCFAGNLTAASAAGYSASPPAGVAWWYSITGDDGATENRHGSSIPISSRCLCTGVTPVAGTDFRFDHVATVGGGPLFVTAPPGDPERVFAVYRFGAIRIIADGALRPQPFLDLSATVYTVNQAGLMSMAFHPDYAANGRFFVFYLELPEGAVAIEEYRVSAGDPDRADPDPVARLLTVDRLLDRNHFGGQLAFGPDGYLYFGIGDNMPEDRAQDLAFYDGKIHRVDVDQGAPYAIPPDNPFVGVAGALPEIWVFGLRMPWRFSFDRATGDLYIGDVGNALFEEIDVQPAASGGGENFGWDVWEGSVCFDPDPDPDCDPAGKTWPVIEYGHDQGCAVNGGYVYRGCAMPDLAGMYFYHDFCAAQPDGLLRSFVYEGGAATREQDWSPRLPVANGWSAFGEDARGELYIVNHGNGEIYQMVPDR